MIFLTNNFDDDDDDYDDGGVMVKMIMGRSQRRRINVYSAPCVPGTMYIHTHICVCMFIYMIYTIDISYISYSFKKFKLILERGKERETLICCSTNLCIHWLTLACALNGD